MIPMAFEMGNTMAIQHDRFVRTVLMASMALLAARGARAEDVVTAPGEHKITMTERSPESGAAKMRAILGGMGGDPKNPASDYDISKESFGLYIPKGYDPNTPYGLFVAINSVDTPNRASTWWPLFDKYQFMWISAAKSGNEGDVAARLGLALDAASYMMKHYKIDPDRVYIFGTSGGGRCASMLGPVYPNIFTGGLYSIGCNSPHRPDKTRFELGKKNSRFVFCTCDNDPNRADTKSTYEAYKAQGYEHCTYIQVPNQAHQDPPLEYFEKAILALDEPLAAQAKKLYDEAVAADNAGKYGEAMQAYARAAARGKGKEFAAGAVTRIAELKKMRQAAWDKAIEALTAKQYDAAVTGLNDMIKKFADIDARQKLAEIEKDPAIQGEIKAARDKAGADQKEEAAKKDLDAAHELLAKNLTQGYEALVRAGKTHGGTTSGAAAEAEAEKLKKERGGELDKVANSKKAQSDLSMAKNYIKNNMRDMARDKLQGILQYAPGSAEAREASELLGGL
jgi:hypothetical protein